MPFLGFGYLLQRRPKYRYWLSLDLHNYIYTCGKRSRLPYACCVFLLTLNTKHIYWIYGGGWTRTFTPLYMWVRKDTDKLFSSWPSLGAVTPLHKQLSSIYPNCLLIRVPEEEKQGLETPKVCLGSIHILQLITTEYTSFLAI